MEHAVNCPLCCHNTFPSKESLIGHLLNELEKISCPYCSFNVSSVHDLIEHLTLNKCVSQSDSQSVILIRESQNDTEATNENTNSELELSVIGHDYNLPINNGGMSKMYIELVQNQLKRPCSQPQQLKILEEVDDRSYFYMSQVDITSKPVTLTTEADGEQLAVHIEEVMDKDEPTYSCSTCGVTFASLWEHIQNHHNNQEIVIEDVLEANSENDNSNIKLEPHEEQRGESSAGARCIITENGKIVEARIVNENDCSGDNSEIDTHIADATTEPSDEVPIKQNIVNHQGSGNTIGKHGRRYKKINNFCDRIVKDIKKEKQVTCHKVVAREILTTNDDNTSRKTKVFQCILCELYVSDVDEFKKHPCETKCEDTEQGVDVKSPPVQINSSDKQEFNEDFKCEVCCTIFRSNKSLKLHKRMHDPIKARALEPSIKNGSGDDEWFTCIECDLLIPLEYQEIHQNSHLSGANTFNCDICNRKFENNEYLKMHMKIHINSSKVQVGSEDKSLRYKCLYCNRQFARPHEKVKHERVHTGEKPHKCEICGKSFRVSYCLTLHMRTHTGVRPYHCEQCGKRFKAYSVYNHHMLTHSDVRAYKCPFCPKAFKTSVQLAGHKNSHTKPFSCQYCNRPFASLYAVRVHTETHLRHNNLKFSCKLCGASYARSFALKDHLKQAHDEDVNSSDIVPSEEIIWSLDENNGEVVNDKEVPQEIIALTNEAETITESESL